ncbi:hypothetical protein G0Q06_08405 [Puniceicoccales bacterium CK1056]|uniref:Uncharacterized protein n=1 Tax=Oceanipulchritudo coccoides TaxID=2706888 RepID=A0A6B2M0N2_9BACT|nr:hypothetical protein [Oceanipulchritudo coccoides]NDV62468.1 hypothetical protein [Oceanipulchritudo coccoides]
MKAAIRKILVICAFVIPLASVASAEGKILFGPYEALTINSEVVRGVKVDDGGKIWLLLNPTYREQEIILKISSEEGAGYRKWFNGSYELVSPANQGKQPNQWTDWIETVSPYIEYWMSGEKILHLKKVK